MKLLKEIDTNTYNADRDDCIEPDDIPYDENTLFIARFWTPKLAVEGLVSVHSVETEWIDFQQVTDDGERVGKSYDAYINPEGIIGSLILRDGLDISANEGYLKQYGDMMDDELDAITGALIPLRISAGAGEANFSKRDLIYNEY